MKAYVIFFVMLAVAASPLAAQTRGTAASNSPAGTQAVPYATVNQVNSLMSQLESAAMSTTADLSRLRINKWKAPGDAKQQAEANRQSIIRNLESALPGMIAAVRNNPDDIAAGFKLYRNLDALYDVLGSVAESAGAFGPKNDYEALANDGAAVERIRRDLADRLETLASSKETELARMRNEVRAAQAAISAAPPKKVVVDDTEPVKKPVRKRKPKTTAKAPASGQAAKPANPQPQP